MNRTLLAVCALLAALCAVQWSTLRRLKTDLAVVDYSAAVRDFDERREEVSRVVAWLDDSARRADAPAPGAQSHGSICDGGALRADTASQMIGDVYVYLRSRVSGGLSEPAARQRVVDTRNGHGR